MNNNDFRYMRRGKQLSELKKEDFPLLEPINQRGKKTEHALLLLHGFSSSPAVFRYLIPQLKHYDALVCPVLPGHAESIVAFSSAKVSDWLSQATQTCEALLNEYTKVDVLGLSLGGLLACELSQRFTLHHLYLLAPAVKLNMNVRFLLMLAMGLKRLGFKELRSAAGNLKTNDDAELAYRRLPLTTIIEMFTFVQEHQWKPPGCPTDLFLGAYDEVVSSPQVEQLFLSLPNASIHWLKNSAHVLPLDNDLNEIIHCMNQNRNP